MNEIAREIAYAVAPVLNSNKQKSIDISSISIDLVEVSTFGEKFSEHIIGRVSVQIGKLDEHGNFWEADGRL